MFSWEKSIKSLSSSTGMYEYTQLGPAREMSYLPVTFKGDLNDACGDLRDHKSQPIATICPLYHFRTSASAKLYLTATTVSNMRSLGASRRIRTGCVISSSIRAMAEESALMSSGTVLIRVSLRQRTY